MDEYDDDDAPEPFNLPMMFAPLHEDLRTRRCRWADFAYRDLLLFPDDTED